jgi:hypothetical protein
MSADNYFITDQNGIYFLTFTVTDWIDVFTRLHFLLSSARDYTGETGYVKVEVIV